MLSAKLILCTVFLAYIAGYANAGLLDYVYPRLMTEFYNQAPTKEGYRFKSEEPNGSKREEIGVIMNPDTPEEQLVIMGTYSTYDNKTDTESITTYTADKDGYKARYKIRKLSPTGLKSLAG